MEEALKKREENVAFYKFVLGILFVLLFVSITLSIMIGPVSIHPLTVWRIAFAQLPFFDNWIIQDWSTAHGHIIWDIRFPRVVLAAVVGAGLSIVGVAIQALVRNSLADPYILGVSSGASVGATLVILMGAFSIFGQYALSAAAFLGALVSVIFVFFISQVGGRISVVRLLLAGIAMSMILSAVTSFIVMTAPREEGIRSALYWMMGNLTGTKWEYLTIPVIAVVVGAGFLLLQSRALNALLMGEENAATLGINIQFFRKSLILTTALVTGVMVAVSGAIGFLGLMIPHIVRLIIKKCLSCPKTRSRLCLSGWAGYIPAISS